MVLVEISSSGENADPACRLWCFPRAIRAERYVVAWRGIDPAVGRLRKNGSPSGRLYVVPVAWLARHRTISGWCQTRPRDRLRRIGCRGERCWLGAPILGVVVGEIAALFIARTKSIPRRLVLLPTYAITPNIIFNAEIEFEHAGTAFDNDDKLHRAVDIEQL